MRCAVLTKVFRGGVYWISEVLHYVTFLAEKLYKMRLRRKFPVKGEAVLPV